VLDCRVDCVSSYAAPECSQHHRLPAGGATSNSGFVDALTLRPHSTARGTDASLRWPCKQVSRRSHEEVQSPTSAPF